MRIQVCSNEGHCPNSKGRKLRNNENTSAKLKNFLLQNQWANFNQIYAIMHPWMKGIQIFQMDTNNIENTLTKFKRLLQKLWVNLNIWIWHKASLGDGNSSLFIWRSIQFSWSSSGFFLLLINVMIIVWVYGFEMFLRWAMGPMGLFFFLCCFCTFFFFKFCFEIFNFSIIQSKTSFFESEIADSIMHDLNRICTNHSFESTGFLKPVFVRCSICQKCKNQVNQSNFSG